MAEILHQLRLVVYPFIYKVLASSQVVVWDFFHQQYHRYCAEGSDERSYPATPRLCFKAHLSILKEVLGGGNSNMFYFHPKTWGFMIQFDKHIFQMGW